MAQGYAVVDLTHLPDHCVGSLFDIGSSHLRRLADEFGVYLPGERRQLCARKAQAEGFELDATLYAALKRLCRSGIGPRVKGKGG